MKKSLLLTLTSIVSLAALGTIAAVSFEAFADSEPATVEFVRVVPVNSNPEDVHWNGSGRMVIVLQKTGEAIVFPPFNCGQVTNSSRDIYDAVVLDPGSGHPAIRLEMSSLDDLKPGDKIVNITNDSIQCCIDGDGNAVSCANPAAVLSVRKAIAELR